MKIGDKVTYLSSDNPLVGTINGETEKSWKILFDNGEQKTVRKASIIAAPKTKTVEVEDPKVEAPKMESVLGKSKNKRFWVVIVALVLAAAVAALLIGAF